MELSRDNNRAKKSSFTYLDQNPERKTASNIVESFLPVPNWPNFARPSTVE